MAMESGIASGNFYIDGQKLKVTAELAKVTFDKQNPINATQRLQPGHNRFAIPVR
jgi:hypothetical protein